MCIINKNSDSVLSRAYNHITKVCSNQVGVLMRSDLVDWSMRVRHNISTILMIWRRVFSVVFVEWRKSNLLLYYRLFMICSFISNHWYLDSNRLRFKILPMKEQLSWAWKDSLKVLRMPRIRLPFPVLRLRTSFSHSNPICSLETVQGEVKFCRVWDCSPISFRYRSYGLVTIDLQNESREVIEPLLYVLENHSEESE